MHKEKMIPKFSHKRFVEVQYADDVSKTVLRIASYLGKARSIFYLLLLVVLFGTLCNIFVPKFQSIAIDIITGAREGDFFLSIVLMLSLYLFYCLCQLVQGLLGARLGQRIVGRLRSELFQKILNLPVSFLDVHSHGDIMSRMTNDIELISLTISQSLSSFISGILTVLLATIMMIYMCWQLTLLCLISIFLTIFFTNVIARVVRKYSRKRQELLGRLNGFVEECIVNHYSIIAYNQQEVTDSDFTEISEELTKANIKTEIFAGTMGPIMNCIRNLSFVICAVGGSVFVTQGLISIGVVSAFIVYVKIFTRPVNELAQIYGQLQTAIAGAERVFIVLDEKVESKVGQELNIKGEALIEFKDVNFQYEKDRPVIKGISLTIPAGKKTALVGETGSGKTTMANLLLRFYDIDSGVITIDGQDIRDISRTALRKNIAIVLQEPVFFSDSIRHNLSFANQDASDAEINNAIDLCHCREIIGKDLNKPLSSELSQGERQLLSIVRAYIADPKILILDEATSNVDTRTEKYVQSAMQRLMQNRTSLIIAHRLSTIQDADMIIVMDDGSIVESGTHKELLEAKGKYYELYSSQM